MKLPWDPEIDTPATIAIIGGGAMGIEAALYARFLGYYVLLVEADKVAQEWRRSAHLSMPATFGQSASPLGLAALEAHRPDGVLPDQSATLSGHEFAEKYLIPLAKTDLLYESIKVHSRVVSISRLGVRRETPGDLQDRADTEFRLAIHSKSRGWYSERADIVLDCSGVALPRSMGPGGGVAMGEIEHASQIDFHTPDLLGRDRGQYAGQRVLLVGGSHAACMNLLGLAELVRSEPATRVTWLVPVEGEMTEPIQQADRLRATGEAGAQLADHPVIQQALSGTLAGVVTLPALGIERMHATPAGLSLRVQVNEDSTLDIDCDRIISSVGRQADWEHASSLRIGRSAILDRPPLELAEPLHQADQPGQGEPHVARGSLELSDSILTMEPHYYVSGSKSFGVAHDRFTLAQGHQQIREAFALIGGRADLDLYRNIQRSSG